MYIYIYVYVYVYIYIYSYLVTQKHIIWIGISYGLCALLSPPGHIYSSQPRWISNPKRAILTVGTP